MLSERANAEVDVRVGRSGRGIAGVAPKMPERVGVQLRVDPSSSSSESLGRYTTSSAPARVVVGASLACRVLESSPSGDRIGPDMPETAKAG